jgi:hypothetical protein
MLRGLLNRNPARAARLMRHVLDGIREIGVLLIAFAPLEAGLSPEPLLGSVTFLFGFLGGGFGLFSLALILEWRLYDVD